MNFIFQYFVSLILYQINQVVSYMLWDKDQNNSFASFLHDTQLLDWLPFVSILYNIKGTLFIENSSCSLFSLLYLLSPYYETFSLKYQIFFHTNVYSFSFRYFNRANFFLSTFFQEKILYERYYLRK